MKHVSVAGCRLEYRDFPAAEPGRPTLLLLHEGLGCVAMWRHFPEKLAAATGCSSVGWRSGVMTVWPQKGHIFQRSISGCSQRLQSRFRRVWHQGQKTKSGSARCLQTGQAVWTWMPWRKASSSSDSSYSSASVLGGRRMK